MSWARKYIGVPFEERARGPHSYDCWGLHRDIAKNEFDREVPSYDKEYLSWKDPHVPEFMVQEASKWIKVPLGQEREGDVVLLRLNGHPNHVGTVIEPGRMVHVMRGVDTCIELYMTPLWRPRIVGIYRSK